MTDPHPPTVEAVLTDIKELQDRVAAVIKRYGSDPVSVDVRKEVDARRWIFRKNVSPNRAVGDRMLWLAEALLDATTAEAFFQNRKDLMKDFGKRVSPDDHARLYVELLTAAWLGLYFLGIPVPELWDRVRRWEEEDGGGLPNGVCVAKAIGDIVRESRKAKQESRGKHPHELRVHSFLPMLMFHDCIEKGVAQEATAGRGTLLDASVHALGRYYEFHQLRLHAHEDLAIHYSVPLDLFRKEIADNKTHADPQVLKARWEAMWNFLRKTVFTGLDAKTFGDHGKRVLLIEPSSPPACFLNREVGLMTFEGMLVPEGSRDIPLPAGYMRPARLKLYRERLQTLETGGWKLDLLSYDDPQKDEVFGLLYNADGTPINPRAPESAPVSDADVLPQRADGE